MNLYFRVVAEVAAAAPEIHNLDFYQAEADQKIHTNLPPEISAKLDLMKPEGLALAIDFVYERTTPGWRCFLLSRSSAFDVANGKDNKGFKVNRDFFQQDVDRRIIAQRTGEDYDHSTNEENEKLRQWLDILKIHENKGPTWIYGLDRNGEPRRDIKTSDDLKGLRLRYRNIVGGGSYGCDPVSRSRCGASALVLRTFLARIL